jgi:hypothetical protein
MISVVEANLAAERTAIERATAADKLAQQVAAVEATLPKFVSAGGAFADALSTPTCCSLRRECIGIVNYCGHPWLLTHRYYRTISFQGHRSAGTKGVFRQASALIRR